MIMEENRYFVPELEEMFVGYEYEYQPWDWKNSKFLDKWINGKYRKEKSIHKIEEKYIATKHLRTLYLSKEDIESLGWEHIGGQLISGGRQDFEKYNYFMSLIPSAHWVIINIKDPSLEEDYPKDCGSFRGKCKSKNELMKLMKWLNIK